MSGVVFPKNWSKISPVTLSLNHLEDLPHFFTHTDEKRWWDEPGGRTVVNCSLSLLYITLTCLLSLMFNSLGGLEVVVLTNSDLVQFINIVSVILLVLLYLIPIVRIKPFNFVFIISFRSCYRGFYCS